MVTVNVVVLAGTVAAEPVQRRMPSGDEVTELRLSVPEAGRRLLPLPIAVWHTAVGKINDSPFFLKYRTAFVGLFVKVKVGAVEVTMLPKVVNDCARFVVDSTRYVRPETLDQFNKLGEVILATGIHAGFKRRIPAPLLAELSAPALFTAVTVA